MIAVIPGTALAGITRMRVQVRDLVTLQRCLPTVGTFTPMDGEIEDYNVNILPCVPITSLTTLPSRTILVLVALHLQLQQLVPLTVSVGV